MKRSRTAQGLIVIFGQVLAATAAVAVPACGGEVASTSAAGDSGLCAPAVAPKPEACADYEVPLNGDLATCSDCLGLCGRAGTCRVDVDAGVAFCVHDCPRDSGPVVVDGRRPPRLRNAPAPAVDLGTHFARMAFFEAASVFAFDQLRRELVAHRAPRTLVRAVARARADEVEHARLAAELAARFGAACVAPEVPPVPTRSLAELALDNAREGCARELLGALFGLYQSEYADDPAVRAFYARIARDEARHAALSLRLHDWLGEQLAPAVFAQVEAARAQASARAVVREVGVAGLGEPSARERGFMAERLATLLAA